MDHCVLLVVPSHNTQITCQLWANYDCDYDCAILPPDIKYTVNSVSSSPCSAVMDVLTLLFLSTRLYWWSLIMQIKSFCNSEKKCYWHNSVVDSIVCRLRMSLSVLDPFVTYVVSLETFCLHYVILVDHIMDSPSKSQTIKQGGKNIISPD